jgi:urease accessory protein
VTIEVLKRDHHVCNGGIELVGSAKMYEPCPVRTITGPARQKGGLGHTQHFPLRAGICAGLALFIQPPTWIATINLAVIPILGLAVASTFACPAALTIILVTAIGLLHGLANGSEITAPMSAWRFIPGMATAAMLILTYGIGVVRSLEKPWARIAVRVAGSWIAAAGIMVCAFKL